VEEADSPEARTEGIGAGADPAAMALALGSASRENSNVFLDKQSHLADLQAHHLQAQFAPQIRQLHLGVWEKWLSILLRIATAFTGLAIAAGLAFMIWNATHDDELVVEAFSVPPDLAAQGRTGQVMASQMLDDLSGLMALSSSARIQSSYATNWGDDLKVEIPETGISLGEFDRYLHKLLGHQTTISGEVVHTATGLAVTARVRSGAGARFSGGDIDALVQQAADAIYRQTQPYRYGVYLSTLGQQAEAEAWYGQHAASGPDIERAWAIGIGLFNSYLLSGRDPDAQAAAQAAVRLKPDFSFGWSKVGVSAQELGQFEDARPPGTGYCRS
jgi:tetratricopeptide (TPR) repeat protein